ncbi:MAG: DUF1232 domain-containing protein [Nitrospirae bacterium]|nr:DUF1232 domain-containing protein [Nitrospirota bacterium]
MFDRLRAATQAVRRELKFYRLVLSHDRTPRLARWLLGMAVAYALSPVDLIPDVIPVIGHLDDVVIVPLLIMIAVQLIPKDVIEECRVKAGSA